MTWVTASRLRGTMTKTAVALSILGTATTGATIPANAAPGFARTPAAPLDDPDPGLPTNPSDPRCAGMPGLAQCQGGPYAMGGAPTGPADLSCISMPSDPACAGGPYAPPPMVEPPPMPAADPSMGMPGHI